MLVLAWSQNFEQTSLRKSIGRALNFGKRKIGAIGDGEKVMCLPSERFSTQSNAIS